MSGAQSDPGVLESAYRTVTPGYRSRGEPSMNLIGWVVFLGAMTLLFPLIPVFLLLLAVGKGITTLKERLQR